MLQYEVISQFWQVMRGVFWLSAAVVRRGCTHVPRSVGDWVSTVLVATSPDEQWSMVCVWVSGCWWERHEMGQQRREVRWGEGISRHVMAPLQESGSEAHSTCPSLPSWRYLSTPLSLYLSISGCLSLSRSLCLSLSTLYCRWNCPPSQQTTNACFPAIVWPAMTVTPRPCGSAWFRRVLGCGGERCLQPRGGRRRGAPGGTALCSVLCAPCIRRGAQHIIA